MPTGGSHCAKRCESNGFGTFEPSVFGGSHRLGCKCLEAKERGDPPG